VQRSIDGMKLLIDLKKNFMSDRNQKNNSDRMQDDMTSKGHGSQGTDKAAGEETAQDISNFVQETQRGKNKVDGDPTQESDQPIDQSRH
jgi:hypothetical protein